MWRPSLTQWRLIWPLAAVVILFWPVEQGRSLAIKFVNWAADPRDSLPRLPNQFSLEEGEDPVAVNAHDLQEAEYNHAYASSRITRTRIRLRDMGDPFEAPTQQQILIAVAVLGSLLIWRIGARPERRE